MNALKPWLAALAIVALLASLQALGVAAGLLALPDDLKDAARRAA